MLGPAGVQGPDAACRLLLNIFRDFWAFRRERSNNKKALATPNVVNTAGNQGERASLRAPPTLHLRHNGFERFGCKNSISFSLPRSIQERFIESTAGQGVPTPLLIQSPVSNPWAVVLAVTAALFFTLCAGFARIGYGDLEHRWALNPPWEFPQIAGCCA